MDLPTKEFLRRQILGQLRAKPAAEAAFQSSELVGVFLTEPIWRQASSLLLYAPLPGEPDVSPLLEEAWRSGKAVTLPRFNAGTGQYEAAGVSDRTELIRGRYGVLEPVANCPARPLNQLDLVLVPGVAFDGAGGRVGRGKGFYDRLLAGVAGHKCGVAFTEQIVAQVPVEPHDMRLDSILTPTRWFPCRRAA